MSNFPFSADPLGNAIFTSQGYGNQSAGGDLANNLSVNTPQVVFSWKQNFSARLDLMASLLAGSGSATYNATTASTALSVTSSSSDSALLQSHYYAPVQPGQTLRCSISAVLGAGQANTSAHVGPHTAADGAFFALIGTVKNIVTRTDTSGTPTDTVVAQSSWNLDTMDGNGPSGITIDWTKLQTFVVDYNWQAGIVRFGFNIGGAIVLCHQVVNNTAQNIFASPNLPAKISVANTGSAASYSIYAMAASMVIFGTSPFDQGSSLFSIQQTAAKTGSTSGEVLLMQIKLKAGITAASLKLLTLAVQTDLNSGDETEPVTFFSIRRNPTIGSPEGVSFNPVDTNSNFQYDVAGTGIVSGGTLIMSDFAFSFGSNAAGGSALPMNFPILNFGSDPSGTSDIITISSQSTLYEEENVNVGSNLFYNACMNWLEPV